MAPVGGAGNIIYLSDQEENAARVSEAGRTFSAESYSRIKKHSPINVTTASGGSEFETVAVGRVILRSESGNSIMWYGGTGDDAPYSGHGMPLLGGQQTTPIPVTNFNAIRICASVSGQIVYAVGFLNGTDIVLTNTVPEQPPPPPPVEAISPLVAQHSPVSGLSGVERNAEISVIFDEAIASGSVVSGSFHLSPAHNVTIYRELTNSSKIVMTPNVLLSGGTKYYAGVNYLITDLVGNSVSGTSGGTWNFTFPFTTVSGAPGADVTPPVVSGTVPTSGATGVSANADVVITFSEAMLSGTIHAQNIYLSYLSGVVVTSGISGTISLNELDQKTVTVNPTPTLLSGGSLVHINILSGVADLASNALGSNDRSRTFTTATYDSTPPTVSSVVPLSGVSGISTATNVVVTFSESMLSGTINASNLYLSYLSGVIATSGISGVVTLSGNGRAAEINPTTNLSGASLIHVNVLTAVQDLAGNALQIADKRRVFSTETLDTTPPTVQSVYPANDATNVAISVTARVTFSEQMLSGTINTTNLFLSITSGGTPNPVSYAVTLSGNKLCAAIDPTSDLTQGQRYYINVLSGVKDLAGNNMTAHNRGNSFTTVYNYQQVYYVTDNSEGDMYDGNDFWSGLELVSSSNTLYNAVVKRVIARLRTNGSPSGTIRCIILNSSDNEVAEIGSMSATQLTSTMSDYTFTNNSQTHAMQVGDYIVLESYGESSSDRIYFGKYSNDGFTGTRYAHNDGSWSKDGGQEIAFDIYV